MNFLPQEILIEILRNVDQNRKQLSLVSKSFYKAIAFLNEENVWMEINSNKLNDESTYKSILKTTRRIRNIEMEFGLRCEQKEKQVLDIIKFQSKNITQLKVGGMLTLEFLEEVLELIPNCNSLDLKKADITKTVHASDSASTSTSLPPPSKKMKMSEPDDFKLHQLKKLILSDAVAENFLLKFMLYLDQGILNELEVKLNTYDYTMIHEFIEKQPNLKILKLEHQYSGAKYENDKILPPTFLNNCDLEYLLWRVPSGTFNQAGRETVNSIFRQMKNLKELRLHYQNEDLWTELFNIIVNDLKELETLALSTNGIDSNALINLNNMEKLRDLTLNFRHESDDTRLERLFSIFNRLRLPQLESFKFLHKDEIETNHISRISKPFSPILRKLHIQIPNNYHSYPAFQAVFRYFQHVESLTIDRNNKKYRPRRYPYFDRDRYDTYDDFYYHLRTEDFDDDPYDSYDDEDHEEDFKAISYPDSPNHNLKELNITFSLDCSIKPIKQLYTYFPNIEKLSLECLRLGEREHIALLKNLRSLTYLKLYVPHARETSFEKRMNAILKHGQNLEVVIYQGKTGSRDVLKMFENKFEYINITRSKLTMAKNRKVLDYYQREEY